MLKKLCAITLLFLFLVHSDLMWKNSARVYDLKPAVGFD